MELQNDGFGNGGIATIGDGGDGNEDVGFRKVGRQTASWDGVRHDSKTSSDTFYAAGGIDEIDDFARFKAESYGVLGVNKNNAPLMIDATIAIIEAVDGGVELVVAAKGHHQKLIRLKFGIGEGRNAELGLAARGGETPFTIWVWQVKATGLADTGIVVFEAGDGFFDRVPDVIVMRAEGFPIDLGSASEGRLGHSDNDGGFA